MNQNLKNVVYGKGSQKHIDFMAEIGGMNDDEKAVFQMLHERKIDEVIQAELGLSKSAYIQIEESVRSKLLVAVFECINAHMGDSNLR